MPEELYRKVHIFPKSIPKALFLYAQHLGNDSHTLPDGATTTKYALLRRPLAASTWEALDYETKNVTDTTEAVQIDRRFVFADSLLDTLVVEGTAYAACRVGAKGDGTYNTYISQVQFDLETVDENNTYTSIVSKTIDFATLKAVSSTSYDTIDVHALLNLPESKIYTSRNLVLRLRISGYVDADQTAGAIRLYYTVGSSDTYVELPVVEA